MRNQILKILLGLFISIIFLFLAFREIDFQATKNAFRMAKYIMLVPTIALVFLSHWFRTLRWYYFLKPVKDIPKKQLFSALMIGYMGNSILPAHLGEFFRAYIIGKKEFISKSTVLATILLERIIDLFTLLLIMIIAIFVYPFPSWVKTSGLILFFISIGLVILLFLCKKNVNALNVKLKKVFKPISEKSALKIIATVNSFLYGIKGLDRKKHYLYVSILSIAIWFCYWAVLHISFYTFNFKGLGVLSSIVLLVITTLSVVIPSSPGYIGTYHFLCQFSLELFGVPRSMGLAYAIVIHAVNMFSLLIVGLFFTWKEGINILKFSKE